MFRFQHAARSPRIAPPKPRKTYRNPIFLAQKWQQALDRGEVASRADLARRLRVSRTRVTQVLGLLTLSPKVLRRIRALGDPLECSVVTERQLRPLVRRKATDQERLVKNILAKRGVGTTY